MDHNEHSRLPEINNTNREDFLSRFHIPAIRPWIISNNVKGVQHPRLFMIL